MSADFPRPARSLPEKPDLRHLKNQAKDRLRDGHATSLTDAQFQLAREYGFSSWPQLKQHVESLQEVGQLKAAIDGNDLAQVQALMTRNPSLHRAPLGYNKNGPLTWAAECRGVPCSAERLAIARWMLDHGSDVHQGGDGPLMRAALSDERIAMMELLVACGADVNALWNGHYPIIFAPCETLAPQALRWLIAHGVDAKYLTPENAACVQMLVCTYVRDPEGKHACLEVFADFGFEFPDAAPTAIHRGRIDLLRACLAREPGLLVRQFALAEIFPPPLADEPVEGLHGAPLDGGTLLHMAVEYHEVEIAQWLIEQGADVNAPAAIDADGFGGHTPLFHTAVTLPPATDTLAKLLLRHGADPRVRTTLRKQLVKMGQPELDRMYEFHAVTAVEFARQFQDPRFMNESAIAAIEGQVAS